MHSDLIKQAKQVLADNFREPGFTIPSAGLYPFQWNWDSGWIALGYANYDMDRAIVELNTLLDAQWDNGMIPHIIFHGESTTYFPGPDFHQSSLHPQATSKYRTTGMIQPPVIGLVLYEIYKRARDKTEILAYIRTVIDKVLFNHEYLYTHRDPLNEGLVYIYHNWEAGTDNSPIWDDIWATMDSPKYKIQRRDTSQVNAEERPTNREYDHYLHIIDIAKEHRYADAKIAEHSPFLVQDPLLNALLIKSNEALISLYQLLGSNHDKIQTLRSWQEKSLAHFDSKLYNEELGVYVHFDLKQGRQIKKITSSSFVPIYAGIPDKDKVARMVAVMQDRFIGNNLYLLASFDPTHAAFDPRRYWRGPAWINVNWMLYHGLLDYGYSELAEQFKADSIELVEKYGFYEYFDPQRNNSIQGKSNGCGGSNFSWTAALLIDFLSN